MGFKNMQSLVEAQIAAARDRGEFENLPGEGKPLDLDEMVGLTPDQKFEAMVLKTVGEVSEEQALLREIRAEREALARCTDSTRCEAMREAIRAKAARVSQLFDARRASLATSKREP